MSCSKLATALFCSLAAVLACSAPFTLPTATHEGGASNSTTSTGGAGADALLQDEPDWCVARAILQAKCQRCHADPLENGAPFPLLSYADTQATDRKGSARYEKMKAALESGYMPPQFLELTPAVEALTANESATLLTWLSGEPPLDAAHCD